MLKLRYYPDPILRKKSEKVEKVTSKVRELLRDMSQVMYDNKGVGLAGSQVGELKRVITFDIGKGLISLVNPKIVSKKGTQIGEEGCLSFPELFIKVRRAQEIEIKGQDMEGKGVKIKAQGLLARVLQHEIDHLDGVLMIDRIGFLERLKIRKKLRELSQLQR